MGFSCRTFYWFYIKSSVIKMKETKIAKENVRKMKITEERIYLLMIFLGVLLILYEVFII